MPTLYAIIVAAPAAIFLILGLIPRSLAGRHTAALCRIAKHAASLCLAFALVALILRICCGPIDRGLPGPAVIGVYFDNLTAAMLLLITTLGIVIIRYAVTYLRGENKQGPFLKYLCFTLGAVCCFVVASNLLMYTLAWIATSFGLHQLLSYYHDRPAATWAARQKFLVSRIGDGFLISALAITFLHFGTTDYAALFAKANALAAGSQSIGWAPLAIATLLALGAMTKSAQFPFHSWLPDTLETPTPVSALMHAGIINAGGFLVIRLSPLLCLSPAALNLLAIVGTTTAVLASLTMMTQTSIKRALAFSTVAQMGFMLLECGLGAFTIAAVHLIAHSLYKAHAFLNSGSVIDQANTTRQANAQSLQPRASLVLFLPAIAIAAALSLIAWSELVVPAQPNLREIILCLILSLAITQLVFDAITTRAPLVAAFGIAAAAGIAAGYTLAAIISKQLLTAPVTTSAATTSLDSLVLSVVAAAFLLLFVLHNTIRLAPESTFARRLYIHAANAFYLDIPAKKITARIYRCPMLWP